MLNSQWYLLTWGLVGLVWLVGALYNAIYGPKVVESHWSVINAPLRWIVLLVLIELAGRFLPANFWAPITFYTPWLRVVGIVILVLSTVFVLWARLALGTLWSSTAIIKQDHHLRTEGPYRVTRHPIYTGILGMLLGTALMDGSGLVLLLLVAILVLFEFKIRSEEALLTKTFGQQYVEYKRHVPQLVPGLTLLRRDRSKIGD